MFLPTFRTRSRKLFTITAFILAASRLGVAATQTVNTSTPVPLSATDWNHALTFAKFDPTLGILQSVEVQLSSGLSTVIQVTNTSANSASTGNARTDVQITLTDPANSAELAGFAPQLDFLSTPLIFNLAANGGTITSGTLTRTGTSDNTFTSAAVLSEFTGNGTVNVGAQTLVSTQVNSSSGNANASQVTSASLTGTVTYTYTNAPFLTITKTPATNSLAPNGTGTFTLTVGNIGSSPTTGLVDLTDPVPANLVVTGVAPVTAGTWDCSLTTGQAVHCTTTNVLATGTSYTPVVVSYTVAPGAGAGSPYTNTATVTGGGDPNPHQASASVTVSGNPILSITKTPATNTVLQNGTGTFTLTVFNSAAATGPTNAQVIVTDPVPAGLTVGTVTSAGNAWDCSATTGQSVNCKITSVVAPGGNYPTITVPYTVAAGITAQTFTNTATQTGGGDPTPHTGSAQVTVPPPALSILKTPATATKTVSSTGSFTLTVSNSNASGTGYTTGTVHVTDPVPAGLTAGVVTSVGSAWDCSASSGQNVDCTIATSLAPGGIFPLITVPYTVALSAAGSTLTNTATQTGGGDPTTHTSSAQVTVPQPPPALSILKTPATATKTVSSTGSFTLTVSNSAVPGTGPTTGLVHVTDPVPVGLTAGTVTSVGNAWDCSASSGQNVDCSISTVLAAGGTFPLITVPYTVAFSAAGNTLTNTATQTGGGDPTTHTSSAQVTVPQPPPALSITKTPASATQQINGIGTFTLTVSNSATLGTGPTSAPVVVTDPVPVGLTVTAVTPGGAGVWNCAASAGQSVSCTTSTILASAASYPGIVVSYTVSSPGLFTNTATETGGGDPTPHSASANVTVPQIPDLTIAKTHTGVSFMPGGSVTFTLTPSNVGGGSTSGVVTVTDTLPAGLTATAFSGTGWACAALPTLSCFRNDVIGPGGVFPVITLVANIGPNVLGTLVNNATVSGGSEINLTNDTASDSIVVTGLPDMTIAKTHVGTVFSPGGSVTFTLTPSNVGTTSTTGVVTVTDTLPAGLTATTISGTGWTCAAPPTLSCTRSDILAGQGAAYPAITVVAAIATTATGTLVNNAVVGGGGETNLTNDTATDSIVVTVPDMTIAKTHTGTTFEPGGSVTYTLTASNVGLGPTLGLVTVTDTLPAGLTATAITAPAPWTCVLSSLTCTTPNVLAAGAAYPAITVTASIASTATGTLVNNTVVGGGNETNLTNDKASDPITITVPDMTITKTHAGTSFQPGGSVTYTLTASNVGTAPTVGVVTVTDTLPTGLTATAITAPAPWTCVLSSLTCTTPTVLANGAAYPAITVTASVAQTATGTLVNNTVVGGGNETNLTNDKASDPISITVPDMTIVKTHTGTSFTAGGSVTFTLAASNVGTAPTSGLVTVSDTLPAGLTATAINAPAPWTCTLANLTCTTSTVLANGSAYPAISVTASIAATASGTLVNNTIVGGGSEINLTNDTASDSITVAGIPDLTITKTHAGTPVRGGNIIYTMIASNVGGSPTSGLVTVTDTLPPNLIATAISGGSTWNCTLSTLVCSTTTVLAPGAAYPAITLTAAIPGNAPATVVNTVVVGGGSETNLTNDTATDPVTFSGVAPNFILVKTYSGLPPIQGGSGTYFLTVSNNGTGPSTGTITLTDPLTTGLTASAIFGDGWNCVLSTLTCTRTDVLAPGASFPAVAVAVNIAADAPANIINVATVTGGTPGTTTSTTGNATITVGTIIPTITISKTSDRSSAELGDVVGYQIVVTNHGTAPYSGGQVVDTLPPGFVYVPGSGALVAGTAASQPVAPAIAGNVLTFATGTLSAQEIETITYRVRITPQAPIGNDVNQAQFLGTAPSGTPGATQIIRYGIQISPGLFTMNQFLIGRVFEDANGNGEFDKGEKPFAGVRVYLSNGASASTDSQGLYNIPLIVPGSVVVSVDMATVPRGYLVSSGGRLDAESTSRLVRTPLQGGAMLRQNFGLKQCGCTVPPIAATPKAAPVTPAASQAPAGQIQIIPQQTSLSADGRSTMKVLVRVLDAQGNTTPAKEIRVRSSAGQFVAGDGSTITPAPGVMGAAMTPGTTLFGVNTQPQLGRTTEQAPQSLQAGIAKSTQGEATFLLLAANQPGEAIITAESGDPEHLLTTTTAIWFTPEKRTPILSSDGEVSVGKAAPDRISYGQTDTFARHLDAFLRTPLGSDYLMTMGYTSHLTINGSNGNAGLFELDPQDRVYQVFGDSSTQYQAAQSNSHVYGRLERGQSYLMFGDMRMGTGTNAQNDGAPTATQQSFASVTPSPLAGTSDVGVYNRNLVGAALHIEDRHHDSVTLEGARPNTAFARDVFAGSTFGLIQFSHTSLVPGSENGVLEIRDRHNPEILLSRETLVRSVDYTMDAATGSLFFLRTLNAYDQSLNLVQLVFSYEYLTFGKTSAVYSARTELRLDHLGTRLGAAVTDQRDPTAGDYYLGDLTLQQRLPNGGRMTVEVPVSHGSALAAGLVSSTSNGSSNVNGTAIRGDIDLPFAFLHARLRESFSKTDSDFFNPFGATVVPGAETIRTALELTPVKKTKLKLSFTGERNKTDLVDNNRKTGSFEIKQALTSKFDLLAGYDYRDYQDSVAVQHIDSNLVTAGLDWHPTSRLTASVRREENLGKADPTYPNETLLSAKYQASETVRLFATQRFASAPIIPIGDLSSTGFATPNGKNETSIGIEDKWSRYTSIQSGYLIENGINGTDSYAVFGLVNRIPVQEHFSVDLGMERGQLLTGKDGSFNSGTIGFSWLPTKNFRTSTRYELRDRGGLGQIITTGAAGRLSQGLTILGRYQYSTAAFQPSSGAVDMLSPLSVNNVLSQQNSANQGVAALAWRSWRTDKEGWLLSYTLRTNDIGVQQASLPQNDKVSMLSTDAYYEPHHRIELYGKFALSDRSYNYVGAPDVSTVTYLVQGRAQFRISHRFDAAVEARDVMQPDTSINQTSVGIEAGFWLMRDLRVGVGYNFRSADEIAANFLTNPIRQGAYFVLSSKLSNMFNLFDAGKCDCKPAPKAQPVPPPPPPVAHIQIRAVTGAHDVCPSEDMRLTVTASGWLPMQTPSYQWYVDGAAVDGATNASMMLSTALGSGRRTITVKVSAGESSATSDPVSVTVLNVPPPTITLTALPSVIPYGDKATLTAKATASPCAQPPTITYTTSAGTLTGVTFDSNGLPFDMSNRAKPQSMVVHFTATATDKIGQTARATADVTVTLGPVARRLDDLVFAKESDRVNNCGKRLLIEELTPMLRNDPAAKVLLIGHRDTTEKNGKLDETRVINAAAVLSAGKGICPQLDLSRVLANWAGTDQTSDTRPTFCGGSTSVKERSGQAVDASDTRAQYRRVEIWFIPGGAELPGRVTTKPLPAKAISAVGCPK